MLKKIQIGSSEGYLVDFETKTKIIDYLYTKLDLSKYRYIILNNMQKLKFLHDNEHYVSPNFRGYNYLLIMLTINNNQYCVAIDRKKLSYHQKQVDMKTIQVIQINLKTSDTIYNGTIFDGKLIQTNGEYLFLIQDCFYLMGSKMLGMEMSQKINHLDTIIKTHFKKHTYCSNFEFKLNKICKYDELEQMIQNLSKLSIGTNGIIFYPKFSGDNVLHIEKKIEKVDINTSNNEIIEQKSYQLDW